MLGCIASKIDRATSSYHTRAPQVQIGDPIDRVRGILDPTLAGLPDEARKPSESFMENGVRVDILYYRSQRQADGLTTDDEFTPYLFRSGVLQSIGWTALGGPATRAQATASVSSSGASGNWYSIDAASNDEVFVINGEVFKARTYCFNVETGDQVLFVEGSPFGACSSAKFVVRRTSKLCDVWCE